MVSFTSISATWIWPDLSLTYRIKRTFFSDRSYYLPLKDPFYNLLPKPDDKLPTIIPLWKSWMNYGGLLLWKGKAHCHCSRIQPKLFQVFSWSPLIIPFSAFLLAWSLYWYTSHHILLPTRIRSYKKGKVGESRSQLISLHDRKILSNQLSLHIPPDRKIQFSFSGCQCGNQRKGWPRAAIVLRPQWDLEISMDPCHYRR